MFGIWQLLNPRAPDEVFHNDPITPSVVQGHAQQRAAARHIEEVDDYEGRSRQEMSLRKKLLRSSAHLAADRVALRRTLEFVEDRWRAGAECDETFLQAEDFRAAEYDRMTGDVSIMNDLQAGIKGLQHEDVRNRLVELAPVSKKGRSSPKKSSPKPRR